MKKTIRILLVEDEPSDQSIIEVTLKKSLENVHIDIVDTRKDLRVALKKGNYDLILSDFKLKGFTGFDVIDEVKVNHLDIPIIMLSGEVKGDIALEAMSRGVNDYVVKSLKQIRLLPAKIIRVLALDEDKDAVKTGKKPKTKRNRTGNQYPDESSRTGNRFISVFEDSPIGVAVGDQHGVIIEINDAGANIVGYKKAELLGKDFMEMIHPDDRHETRNNFQALFSGEQNGYQLERRYLHKRGQTIWCDIFVSLIRDVDGNPHHVIVQAKDITARKMTEKALHESEERFRSSFEYGPLGMGIADKTGNIIQVNKALSDLSGWSEEELIGKNFREFIHSDDIALSTQNLTRLITGEVDHYRQTRRYFHKKGHHVWVDINVAAINDANGKPLYLINHLQDITERILAETLQEAQRKILEQIVTGNTQQEILSSLCLMIETLSPTGSMASVFLLDSKDEKLYLGAAPNVSEDIINAFQGMAIAEGNTSCGTAAYRGEQVLVDDISTSSLWNNYCDFALEHNIHACWSTPFFSERRAVLGTFAISLPRPTSPTKYDIERIKMAASLASIVVERTRAVEAIRESEARFRSAFGNAPMGNALISTYGEVIQTNNRLTEIIGYSAEELVGKTIVEITHPDDIDESMKHFRALMSGEVDEYQLEERYKHKHGGYVWCRLSISSVGNSDNQPIYAIAHIENITERIQNEQALLKSHRALRVLNECNHTLVHTEDLQDLLDQICRIIIEIGGYRFAWVGYAVPDENKSVHAVAFAGHEAGYLRNKKTWTDDERSNGPVGTVIRTGEPYIARNIQDQPAFEVWRKEALERGYQSEIVFPLKVGEHSFGSLAIFSGEVDAFDSEEEKLLTSLAGNLAYGILSLQSKYEQTMVEDSLRRSEYKFHALYDENPSMFFTVDRQGTIWSINKHGAGELGYNAEELINKSIFDICARTYTDDTRRQLEDCFSNPNEVRDWETQKIRKDGTTLWVKETAKVSQDTNGNAILLIVSEDITDVHALSDQLAYQASHDFLTGLVNRREFEQRLQSALNNIHDKDVKHVFCYIDIDQFKIINDTCGHQAGDRMLLQLGLLLNDVIRKNDTLARLGGDEFGVLLIECQLEEALGIVDKLLEVINQFQFVWEDKKFKLNVSIGLVTLTGHTENITEAFRLADEACYMAKDKGGNRVHIYSEEDADLSRVRGEMQWKARIENAFEEERFRLYYQNIVAVDNPQDPDEFIEILLRMEDEQGDIILPGSFLPAAERYGLILEIDCWVISNTLKWLEDHPEKTNRIKHCGINISGQSLGDSKLLDYVVQKHIETNIPFNKICFEVTETAAISEMHSAFQIMEKITGLGCKFALDDFGSGLSSFGYLKILPVDFIKIDGMFIQDITEDPFHLAIVKSICDIGKVSNKKIIAEYVENEAIYNQLKEIGVDYVQGFGISQPKPINSIMLDDPAEIVDISVHH